MGDQLRVRSHQQLVGDAAGEDLVGLPESGSMRDR